MWPTWNEDPVLPCDDTGECISLRCYRYHDCDDDLLREQLHICTWPSPGCDQDCDNCGAAFHD